MIHKLHFPEGKLSKYVATMVYNKNYHPEHKVDKYLPDGTINIIFELSGNPKYIYDNITKKKKEKYSNVWFSGVLKEFITISAESEEMIIVVFKPGAGYPLTHKPSEIFTDKVIHAEDIFGQSIIELHKRLKQSSQPEEKFREIENWLSKQLKEDDFYTDIIQFAIEKIKDTVSEVNILEIAKKSGYSQKQFIELFKKYVGITPKQLHRIIRFNEILLTIEKKEKIAWASIAVDSGYYDQAHFIKDFQSFSGLNPKKYLNDIGDYPNFFPVK